jgi:CHAD domain-containing protein
VIDERPDMLRSPVAPIAARIALGFLDAARAAQRPVETGADSEALHDFRVALRRLRSTIRSFQSELNDAIPKKLRNALRDLARATTPARDAEVLVTWAKQLEAELPTGKRAGISWFHARLATRRDRGQEEILNDVIPAFSKLERRLRKALGNAARSSGDGASYAAALAEQLTEHAALLEQELGAFQSSTDDDAAHSARIAAKRLRYLLEPVVEVEPRAAAIVGLLKALQTLLGEAHDLAVLAEELGDAVTDAAVEHARREHDRTLGATRPERSGPRAGTAGLIALARVVQSARDERYRRFTTEWRGATVADLLSQCAALAAALSTPPVPPSSPREQDQLAPPDRPANPVT